MDKVNKNLKTNNRKIENTRQKTESKIGRYHKMICTEAVSYTHLDVYKRQAQHIPRYDFIYYCK